MLTKIIVPATLPYVFTGYRLSLGLAWLVIVAAEMLTGTPGVGGFLWQEYNSLVYSHILLSVITIGAIGFVLDRLMGLVEARVPGGLMAFLEVRGLEKSFATAARDDARARRRSTSRSTQGEFVAVVGYSGLGQDHAGLADRRAPRPRRRRHHARRRAGHGAGARARHRVPAVLAAAVDDACSTTSSSRSTP